MIKWERTVEEEVAYGVRVEEDEYEDEVDSPYRDLQPRFTAKALGRKELHTSCCKPAHLVHKIMIITT